MYLHINLLKHCLPHQYCMVTILCQVRCIWNYF